LEGCFARVLAIEWVELTEPELVKNWSHTHFVLEEQGTKVHPDVIIDGSFYR
jgi:hypothetical protein